MPDRSPWSYERWSAFVRSPKAATIAFFWGLAEATFFFLVPDVFWALSGLIIPVFAFRHGVISIAGTVVGGFIMFNLGQADPVAMEKFLTFVPGIPLAMIHEIHSDLHLRGFWALVLAPLDGLPYKIFAVNAGIIHMDLIQFLLVTIPARLERVIVVGLIAAGLGKVFQKSIQKNTKAWVIGYVVFWVLFYVLYSFLIAIKYSGGCL